MIFEAQTPLTCSQYVFDDPDNPTSHILTYLPTSPPTPSLAIGTTAKVPPTPDSLSANPKFLSILSATLAAHAHSDPYVQSQAAAMASSSGAALLQPNRRQYGGAAGASDQAGAGGGGVGGWIHVSDLRHPPDFGRIAEPEDIFGSLEVDGDGKFTDGTGHYQESGTYRVVTRDGILGLTDFLRGKLVEALKREEAKAKY